MFSLSSAVVNQATIYRLIIITVALDMLKVSHFHLKPQKKKKNYDVINLIVMSDTV